MHRLCIASQKRQAIEWKWEKHELIVEVAEEHKTDHKVYHLDLAGSISNKKFIDRIGDLFTASTKRMEY